MTQPYILEYNKNYGLCNTDLFTLWDKTKHGLGIFDRIVEQLSEKSEEQILDEMQKLMKDKTEFDENRDS